MPRLSASLPKYRKHRASGQAVVTICGRDHYLGPHGSTASKHAYDRLVAEWLASGRQLPPSDPVRDAITVVEIIAAYVTHCDQYYRKGGELTREYFCTRDAAAVLNGMYGRTPAAEFGPVALRAVRDTMIAKGWTRKYINKQVGRIVRMFRWATSHELIGPHVHQALATLEGLKAGRTDAPDRAPVLPVPDDVVDKTLEYLAEIPADMVRLQRLTGCRPDEVCRMKPIDIDRRGEIWIYRPEAHKTQHRGRERLILIGPKGQALLAPYLLRGAESYCFCPQEAEEQFRRQRTLSRTTPQSSGNRPGTNRRRKPQRRPSERYQTASYRRAIHRACDRAKVDRWGPNRLRHAAATEIRSKYGLEAAQVVLGHSQADVTQVYAERDLRLAERIAKEVG